VFRLYLSGKARLPKDIVRWEPDLSVGVL
jgi:hypothetical protein